MEPTPAPGLKAYVAYYRVSIQRQGNSGLGLAAQCTSVNAYLAGRGQLTGEFTEARVG